jgi:hypothetical protein
MREGESDSRESPGSVHESAAAELASAAMK